MIQFDKVQWQCSLYKKLILLNLNEIYFNFNQFLIKMNNTWADLSKLDGDDSLNSLSAFSLSFEWSTKDEGAGRIDSW